MNAAPNDRKSYYPTGEFPRDGSVNWQQDSANSFVPTAVQRQRADDLKRFNRWVIYVPLGLIATAVLGLLVYLLIIAIWPPYEDTRFFLSGVADIILILFLLPVALIFGLLLAGIIGGSIYWQQSRKKDGDPSLKRKYGRLRLLLWQADQKLSGLYAQTDKLMPLFASPVIRFNVWVSYFTAWLAQLAKQLNRRDAE